MKATEFKLRVINLLNGLIDDYFGGSFINERFINATLKFLVKQNSNKYDNILNMFADENGEIDAYTLIDCYANMLGENGLTIDLKSYINNDYVKSLIPNKILILKKEDLLNIIM